MKAFATRIESIDGFHDSKGERCEGMLASPAARENPLGEIPKHVQPGVTSLTL